MKPQEEMKFFEQLKAKFKENLIEIIIGVVSVSAINYVISRFFLVAYFHIIDYNAFLYDAMVDESSKNLIFMGIMIIFLGVFITITGIPMALRYLYHDIGVPSFFLSRSQNRKIDIATIVSFFSVFIVILCMLMFANTKAYSMGIGLLIISISTAYIFWQRYWSILNAVVSEPNPTLKYLINNIGQQNFGFVIKEMEIKSIKVKYPKFELNLRKILGQSILHAVMFIAISFSLFEVCLYFLLLVNSSATLLGFEKTDWGILLVTAGIWALYSFVFGARISQYNRANFIVDVGMGCILIYLLLLINFPIFMKVIAETTGIKDRGSYVYRMKKSDFEAIKNDVQKWKNYVVKPTKDGEPEEKFNLDNAFKTQEDEVYIATTMIYKNEKNAIICPPKIDIFSEQNWVCSFVDRDKFIPTALSMDELKKEKP